MSFPPLFGHQFVGQCTRYIAFSASTYRVESGLLCGVTWGFAEGFAIVALGTLLGEIANFLFVQLSYERNES